MDKAQKVKGKVFKDLHSAEGMFVMPNAWNAGSACMLEAAGFPAVGTTSAGIAFCLGLPDYEGVLTREAALDETRRIAGAVRIPVSVDAENGYGHTPEAVADYVRNARHRTVIRRGSSDTKRVRLSARAAIAFRTGGRVLSVRPQVRRRARPPIRREQGAEGDNVSSIRVDIHEFTVLVY